MTIVTSVRKCFQAYFYHTSFAHLSLGAHLDLSLPNLEIHIPFGFIRIGWSEIYNGAPVRWHFGRVNSGCWRDRFILGLSE